MTTPRRAAFTAFTAMAATATLSLGVAACGLTTEDSSSAAPFAGAPATASGNPRAPIKKGLTIAFLPKQINNPYFTIADNGGKKAVTALGSTYKEVGPSSGSDTSGQISYVNALTRQKVSAIVVSAQDAGALCTALRRAMKSGIKVVTYDSDTSPNCRQLFISPAGAEALGRSEVQLLAKQIDYKGEIAILSAAKNATNQNTWIRYMKDELKNHAYQNIKLVKVAYGNDDAQTSLQQTQSLLRQYPDLKGIIAPTAVGMKAAAQYVSGSGYKGEIQLTGLGTPNDMRAYIKNGTVTAFELWDPAQLGSLAAYAAVSLASGHINGMAGETFAAGQMGLVEVDQNGVVLLGDPTIFDKTDIDSYDF